MSIVLVALGGVYLGLSSKVDAYAGALNNPKEIKITRIAMSFTLTETVTCNNHSRTITVTGPSYDEAHAALIEAIRQTKIEFGC